MIVTFGEIMGRLSPAGFQRLSQTLPGSLNFMFAGAEANVAASLALLGADTRYVTALPNNAIGDSCIRTLRGLGIDTGRIVQREEGRLGLFFVETGANQRPSQVVYDRSGTTIGLSGPEIYDWPNTLAGAQWLHLSGITPAISAAASESTLAAAQAAKAADLTVSCDLNFRGKLWRWQPSMAARELAEQTMRELLPYVDVVVANEADCHDVLGIQADDTDVDAGRLSVSRYPQVAQQLVEQFPNVSKVGITLRESHSATHNDWGGMLYDASSQQASFAPLHDDKYVPYPIHNIVDRVGAGDSFAAGLIYSLTHNDFTEDSSRVSFAVAASCLAHSVEGDFNFSSRAEIEALMGGSTSGRVIR